MMRWENQNHGETRISSYWTAKARDEVHAKISRFGLIALPVGFVIALVLSFLLG